MAKKLRIAQIAPYWFSVPPQDYGGTERVISNITEELVKRGHEVTLFATPTSKTKAKLVSPVSADFIKTIEFYSDPNFQNINHYVNYFAFKKANEFDIIHSHSSFYSFYFCDFVKTPVVHTLHNQLPRSSKTENNLFKKFRHLNFISISNEFRTHFDLNYIATVYHGLNLKYFPFNQNGGSYLFWIGRISKNKGEVEAIYVAEKTGYKLMLALSMRKDATDYFNNVIKPHVNKNISILLTNVKYTDTAKYYGQARLFIFPVQWKEPFGLIMIESMACGTPVVAYARGSVPEIIKDGQTGFIVNPSETEKKGDFIIKKTGIEGLCEAVERIYSMPEDKYREMRYACRAHIEQNFTVEKMVDNYEKVYRQVIDG